MKGHANTNASPPPRRFTVDANIQESYRALTLQQPSNAQKLFRSGRVVIGASLSTPSRHVAKIVAVTGADWCWIDAEHVAWETTLLVECIQIIIHESGGKMIPVVRVPSKTSFDYMAWCLDAGAGGIIVPHIETVEEMHEVINACRFPPIGHRSYPPFTFIDGVTDRAPEGKTVFSVANEHVAIIPQVESRFGIANLEEIAGLKEITALMIGGKYSVVPHQIEMSDTPPSAAGDLRLDMNLPLVNAMDGNEPEFVAAMNKASAVAKKNCLPLVGLAQSPELARTRIDQGFRVLAVTSSFHTLAFGMMHALGSMKAAAEEHMAKRDQA
uniref:2,4-dihydroxyhept-2-ene-1,7-dioic acid aldolase n=1 Tax=Mycena chlorophos TaxID=658473 RepID=A0ABQ0KXN1_MYCCL|nr:2,4-dihydroxyhept-2-ene-1,7-dioic acid aldolase [Mycena chlorophos]